MQSKKKEKKRGLSFPKPDTYHIDAIGPKNNECKISLPVKMLEDLCIKEGEGWYE